MRAILFLMLSVFIFSSCSYIGGKKIRGNGSITSQTRKAGSFNSIEVGGAILVRLKQDASSSVKVETDNNLMEYIDIYTDGNTLKIHTKKGYNLKPSKDVIVYVTAPELTSFHVSGASSITGENNISFTNQLQMQASGASKIDIQVSGTAKVNAKASGASTLVIKGQAGSVDVSLSGASSFKGFDFITENAVIDLSGASEAEVHTNKQLNVEASGASNVRYKGAAAVNSNTSGASNISKAG
jgi:carbon monoxide dehydrogenase subunit G